MKTSDVAKASVYIETSVVSYLVARPSRDLLVASHQQVTHEWWNTRKEFFACFVSDAVREEARSGNPDEAKKRLDAIEKIRVLEISDEAVQLGRQFLTKAILPEKAATDALHIATAIVNGIDFLLTWNCKHIANAQIESRLRKICIEWNLTCPVICTPEELMEIEP